jgi:RNA-binding protein 39
MFDASAQTEPEWEKEVAEDVSDECSKFGAVLHLHVDKASQVREWEGRRKGRGCSRGSSAGCQRWLAVS